jgi:hypothetical protein
MLFPEINLAIGKYLSEFNKDDKHLLITPIKRTLENKTPHKLGCFFKTMIGKMAYS